MSKNNKDDGLKKAFRLVQIFRLLSMGGIFSKKELAQKYSVTEKTIYRDILDLNTCLQHDYDDVSLDLKIENDRKLKGYVLKNGDKLYLSKEEALVISKILMESKSLCKAQLDSILNKLLNNCWHKDKELIKKIIFSEKNSYIEPRHGDKDLVDKIWGLSRAIRENKKLSIKYKKLGKDGKLQEKVTERKIIPLGLLFSEYYFYLLNISIWWKDYLIIP